MSAARHQGASAMQRADRERLLIAREAARLISESGMGDHRQAIAKAALRLGIRSNAAMPDEQALEDALREYQRLFRSDSQPRLLRQRREAALAAMRFLEDFKPRLVGPVLDGTADVHSVVSLQVFSDDADAVSRFLQDHAVPARLGTRRMALTPTAWSACTVLSLEADGLPFELVVLPLSALRQAPLTGADPRPMRRASASRVQQLLDEGDLPPPASARN